MRRWYRLTGVSEFEEGDDVSDLEEGGDVSVGKRSLQVGGKLKADRKPP